MSAHNTLPVGSPELSMVLWWPSFDAEVFNIVFNNAPRRLDNRTTADVAAALRKALAILQRNMRDNLEAVPLITHDNVDNLFTYVWDILNGTIPDNTLRWCANRVVDVMLSLQQRPQNDI